MYEVTLLFILVYRSIGKRTLAREVYQSPQYHHNNIPQVRAISQHLPEFSSGRKAQGTQECNGEPSPPPFLTRSSQDNATICVSPKIPFRTVATFTEARSRTFLDLVNIRILAFILQNNPCPRSANTRLQGPNSPYRKQPQHLLSEGFQQKTSCLSKSPSLPRH